MGVRAVAIIATLVTASVVSTSLVPPFASTAQAADCSPGVTVVGFRGSGEGKASHGDVSNGWSGPMLTKIIDRARKITYTDGSSFSTVPILGVPYPAIPMSEFADNKQDLFESTEKGRLQGIKALQDARQECESMKFILMGYSQGVIVARQVATSVPQDWVVGVFGVGDPAQKPNGDGVRGDGRSGNGVYRAIAGSQVDDFYSRDVEYASYCHSSDPICDFTEFSKIATGGAFHGSYGKDYSELSEMALIVAAWARTVTKNSASNQSGSLTFDVMNTSEELPDGVWFRESPRTADTKKTTGLGVYEGESVRLTCYGWGDSVSDKENRLWYQVVNLTRPKVNGEENSGWLNAHYVDDKQVANVVDGGVKEC